MDIAATITALLLALLFGFHAYKVATGDPMQRTSAETLRLPYERFRLVAIPEAAAAVGLVIGIFVRPLAAAAAIGLTLLMLGAAIMRLRVHDEPKNWITDLVIALFAAATAALQLAAM
jgi:uncharacterized membrane protein YphA (DoxX/SURF4 family)